MKGTVIIDEYSSVAEKRSPLTIKDLEEAMTRLEFAKLSVGVKPFFMASEKALMAGLKIIEAPAKYEPVLKLRDDAPVSDAFREEMNAYLLDLFGTRDVSLVRPGQAYLFGENIVMRPETAVLLRSAAA